MRELWKRKMVDNAIDLVDSIKNDDTTTALELCEKISKSLIDYEIDFSDELEREARNDLRERVDEENKGRNKDELDK